VRIVVLLKPVPDTTGQERLGPDLRVDRTNVPVVVNANDEYALEAALKLVEAAGEGEVTLLAMAPAAAPETLRKALAMGAQRGVLICDPSLAGSDTLSTVRVLAAGLRRLEYDLVLAGADTSDGGAGVVAAGVAVSVGLPYLSYAARIEPGDGRVVVHRLSPVGYDVIEATLPALVVATQALGEPRYPSLRGIMAARSKEISTWSLADLELGDAPVGGAVASTQVVSARPAASRGATRVIREPAAAAAAQVVEFLAERRLI
jgi:electron transfer flavoprotein beta subunit